jgi:hypothetical protein
MATNIMKGADLIILPADQKDGKACKIERLICPGLAELGAMGKIDPCLEICVSCRAFALLGRRLLLG